MRTHPPPWRGYGSGAPRSRIPHGDATPGPTPGLGVAPHDVGPDPSPLPGVSDPARWVRPRRTASQTQRGAAVPGSCSEPGTAPDRGRSPAAPRSPIGRSGVPVRTADKSVRLSAPFPHDEKGRAFGHPARSSISWLIGPHTTRDVPETTSRSRGPVGQGRRATARVSGSIACTRRTPPAPAPGRRRRWLPPRPGARPPGRRAAHR